MPDEITVEITGLRELGAALNSIPAKLSGKILREALHAAGDVIAQAAESTAPVRTGELRGDIITKVHVGGDLSNNYVLVGPGYDRATLKIRKRGNLKGRQDTTTSPGVYGKFLEFGTRFVAARPWLRPAFESSKESALGVLIAYLRAGLEAVGNTLRGTNVG